MSTANPFLAGQCRELWAEHFLCNPTSFSTTFASDDWRQQAGVVQLSPARVAAGQTIQRDLTGYTAIPTDGDWHERVVGYQSPTRPAGTSGLFKKGLRA
jgi:hypothetical protein